jgi:acyl phosphate:glycerol-3-phosphate acyltransferase
LRCSPPFRGLKLQIALALSIAMEVLAFILTILTAYLLGSIPTGFLVGKSKGIDIRKVGSGNIGATNAFRILGKPAGILVLLADALKGWVAVAVVAPLIQASVAPWFGQLTAEWLRLAAALAAVLGHNYTCFLFFKGGKGVATSAGVLTALVPWALVIILAVFILVVALTRYISLGSISAAFTLPFATWITTNSINMTIVTAVMGILAIYKHRGNIKRLLDGTENQFGRKS